MTILIDEFIRSEESKGYALKDLCIKRECLESVFSVIGKPIDSITGNDILSYIRGIDNRGSSVKKLVILRQFLEYITGRSDLPSRSVIKPEKVVHSTENEYIIITDQVINQIIQTIPFTPVGMRDMTIILLLFSTGMGVKLLTELNIYNVDIENSIISVYNAGPMIDGIIKINPTITDVIKKYLRVREYLLHFSETEKSFLVGSQAKRLKEKTVINILKNRISSSDLFNKRQIKFILKLLVEININ